MLHKGQPSLGSSARASLIWSGGFTLMRDFAQFGLMLILVRLLSPADYGVAALVQSIIGFLSMISYATFSQHALQVRDPSTIDWQAHFTAATAINIVVFVLVLLVALGLSFTARYHEIALQLATLGLVFLVEIPGTLRARMLEANHDWKRYRVLLAIGTLLGMGTGLLVALVGGGVWALIVQPPMLSLPAAFDLLFQQRFKPDWGWNWARSRDTIHFGLSRVGSGLLVRSRTLGESALLSSVYSLATLGMFTRANGLANLLAGRIGATAVVALYPVLTRAERGSARFQRLGGLVLRGVCWTTFPAVAFLAISADDTVRLLYGTHWESVVPLLPSAAVVMGFLGVRNALSGLLLANENVRAVLLIDAVSAGSAIALAFLLVPHGVSTYLLGLAVQGLGLSAITIAMLLRRGAISAKGVIEAIGPTLVAGLAGLLAAISLRPSGTSTGASLLRIFVEGGSLAIVYLAILRLLFSHQLVELVEVVPGQRMLSRVLILSTRPEFSNRAAGQ